MSLSLNKNTNSNFEYKIKQYFIAIFIISYAFFFIGAYLSNQSGNSGVYMVYMVLGTMTPFLVSVLMVAASKNNAMKKDFINRLIDPRLIHPKMMPFILFIMPLSVLASIVLSLPLGGSVSQFQFAEEFSFSAGVIPVLLLFVIAACFEELGWRGYAFESLQSRYSVLKASILFSIFWSLWHFPLVFVHDSYQYNILHENIWYCVNFFASIIPMGVIVSWVCLKNKRSIISAILFHFVINMSQEMFAITQITKCIETFVLVAVAAAIVVLDKELFLAKNKNGAVKNQVVFKTVYGHGGER